jgi:hypothetical protein
LFDISDKIADDTKKLGRYCFTASATVESVDFDAQSFCDCQRLSSICIPRLKFFCARAFDHSCLVSMSVPSSVERIGKNCFSYCERLRTVTFPLDSKLTRIEDWRFSDCSLLTSFCVPSSLKSIGVNCFARCQRLCRLTFSLPSRLGELLDLPGELRGLVEIPDSIERLTGETTCLVFRSEFAPTANLCCSRE